MYELEEGQEVIIISNNYKQRELRTGTYHGLAEFKDRSSKRTSYMPKIRMHDDGILRHSFGIVIPRTPEMEECLNSMTPERRWEVFGGIVIAIQTTRRS